MALEKSLADGDEPALQNSSFDAARKFAELCPNNFGNFTSTIITRVLQLAVSEVTELAAQDCLRDLVKFLPPISLVDPLCSVICETHDDELRMVAYNTIIQIPLLLKKSVEVGFCYTIFLKKNHYETKQITIV